MQYCWHTQTALLMLLALCFHARAEAQDPALLFEQAAHAQETAGDLDKAIELYKQIVDDEKSAPRHAAKALLQMGECYVKKGDTRQAAEQYKSVIARFAKLRTSFEEAKKRLARISPELGDRPTVVATVPATLSTDVSPSLEQITVTFDRPMMDNSWSWTGGGDTYPEMTGRPSYDRLKMTCTLPVKLEPGKVYWVGINALSFHNFQTTQRVPAPWYPILFATRRRDGRPTPIPEDLLKEVERIKRIGPKLSERPTVVATVPAALSADVSPSLDAITVTFDHEMIDKNWSWTGGGETFPKINGEPSYDEKRTTCRLPVKLEPGKVYWVGINSPSHKNFKTAQLVPARRYVIFFATSDSEGRPTPLPDDLLKQAKAINGG